MPKETGSLIIYNKFSFISFRKTLFSSFFFCLVFEGKNFYDKFLSFVHFHISFNSLLYISSAFFYFGSPFLVAKKIFVLFFLISSPFLFCCKMIDILMHPLGIDRNLFMLISWPDRYRNRGNVFFLWGIYKFPTY